VGDNARTQFAWPPPCPDPVPRVPPTHGTTPYPAKHAEPGDLAARVLRNVLQGPLRCGCARAVPYERPQCGHISVQAALTVARARNSVDRACGEHELSARISTATAQRPARVGCSTNGRGACSSSCATAHAASGQMKQSRIRIASEQRRAPVKRVLESLLLVVESPATRAIPAVTWQAIVTDCDRESGSWLTCAVPSGHWPPRPYRAMAGHSEDDLQKSSARLCFRVWRRPAQLLKALDEPVTMPPSALPSIPRRQTCREKHRPRRPTLPLGGGSSM